MRFNALRRRLRPEFGSWRFWWSLGRDERLHILMYHSIADNPRDPHAVPPEAFTGQMQALADQRCCVLPLEEAVQRLQQGASLRGCVALTFDDGYRDFLTTALPVLERFAFPSTVFVPAGLVGGKAVWDSHDPTKPLMDWDELREVHRHGVAVASHTVHHLRLSECDDRTLEWELSASLETLQEQLDEITPALSYPGGAFTSREMRAARNAGYIYAVGVSSRWANGPETDRFALRREAPSWRAETMRQGESG